MHKYFLLLLAFVCFGCTSDINVCGWRKSNLRCDRQQLEHFQEIPLRALTYCDVIELAVTRNIDLLSRNWQYEIQRETVTGQRRAMLPALTFRGNDETRSNRLGQASVDFATGLTTVPPSVSTVRPARTLSVGPVWSLLDFGLSYYKSRIEEKRLLIVQEQNIRLKQNLILDVTKSYWKAVVAKEAITSAKHLMKKIKLREASLESEIQDQIVPQTAGYDNARKLAELLLRLYGYEYDYFLAKAELSGLIGIKVGICYELAEPTWHECPEICISNLEEIALINRPELKAGDIDEKLQADEVRAAIVGLFPNAQVFGGWNMDHNHFLVFQNWWNIGYRMTWELLDLPKNISKLYIAKDKKRFSHATRLALYIGVLSQVNLAYYEYLHALKEFELTRNLAEMNARLLHAQRLSSEAGEVQLDDSLKLETDALTSYMNTLIAYGNMQIALEKIGNAIGRPLSLTKSTQKPLTLYSCQGELLHD